MDKERVLLNPFHINVFLLMVGREKPALMPAKICVKVT